MVNSQTNGGNSTIINLTENELIGVGSRRFCYRHPDESGLCIKIPKSSKNGLIQQRREVKYYRNLEKRGVPFKYIAKFRGSVNTSQGEGFVYDAIVDNDGSASLQMIDYLKQEPERGDEYLKIIVDIENYLFDNLIIFYDISPYNILCRKNSDGHLEPYIIDGVGDVVRIPILNLSKMLVRQKIKRRWLRLIGHLQKYDWMKGYRLSH